MEIVEKVMTSLCGYNIDINPIYPNIYINYSEVNSLVNYLEICVKGRKFFK
jgi:hypothetical protein